MTSIYKNAVKLIKDIADDELTVYAAQASYYIIISAFPFAMLLLSLVGFIMPEQKQTVIGTIQAIVPNMLRPTVTVLADELFEKSISLLSLTALTSLWTASRGIAAVQRGIKQVYCTPNDKNFFVATFFSIIYTVIFIGILIFTLILQVFGNTVIGIASNYVKFNNNWILLTRGLLFFIITSLVFQLMYHFFSKRKYPFFFHFPGAVVSSVFWMVFSKIYSVYIDNFANYSYIYGSLTAVVLLMLWLFFCVIILLSGAELNRFIIKLKKRNEQLYE
ncbi:MAG: YihY/virulence factor BrkB family protein [Clostridia bacterium]|nr:YihY/virulence factor BrkB family protein [Clostridia bacterium]